MPDTHEKTEAAMESTEKALPIDFRFFIFFFTSRKDCPPSEPRVFPVRFYLARLWHA